MGGEGRKMNRHILIFPPTYLQKAKHLSRLVKERIEEGREKPALGLGDGPDAQLGLFIFLRD